ncbi:MAG: AMP-binding protein [Clostridia bacterium]|nr:AMP-binding protein [Clostridia bacterium]
MYKKYVHLKEMIEDCAVKYENNIAFKVKSIENGKAVYDEITYARFAKEIEYLAKAFIEKGLAGKRIAVIGKNSYEWIVVFLAAVFAGGTIVPLDRGLLDYEIEDQIKRSEAVALFYGGEFRDRVASFDMVKVCTEDQEFKDMLLRGKEADNKAEYDSVEIKPDEMSILLFTSGTTSASKAVMLSQTNIMANIYGMSLWEKFYETDVNMALLPFHHTFGMVQTMLFLSFGMCNVFCEGLRIAKCLNEYGVTIFVGVPRIIEEMMLVVNRKIKAQGKEKTIKFALKLSNALRKVGIDIRRKLFKQILDGMGGKLRLVIIGAAAASPDVLKFFNDIGVLSIQGYGLTETSPVLSAENDKHMRKDSVGLAIPGVEVRIDNPDENGIGEIIAKGDNVMLGYYNDPEKTAEVIKNGWFYTGDLGRMDKDGFIFICGRKKNVIVLSNGKNVFPEELETLVNLSPAIKESLVYAEGNDICCTIVSDENFAGDVNEAIAKHIESVNEQLILYKKISRYTVTETEMAKTTTGKIKR